MAGPPKDLVLTKKLLAKWVSRQKDLGLKLRGRTVLLNLRRFCDGSDTHRVLVRNVASFGAAVQAAIYRTPAGGLELVRQIDREITRKRLSGEFADDVRSIARERVLSGEALPQRLRLPRTKLALSGP